MKYDLFLFDLDDTLLDFKESERLSFVHSLNSLGLKGELSEIFIQYQKVNRDLWKLFEDGKTTKEHLKVERFKRIFDSHHIDIDPELASHQYLSTLPEKVVLIKHAEELCQRLYKIGEIGIVTNGIEQVQMARINNSPLAKYISFTAVSEVCGHAKPDPRFFHYSTALAKKFEPNKSLVIGDRLETDILGAKNFLLDSCWFNPKKNSAELNLAPTFEISCLSQFFDTIT
jgi:2-haloacid dehalogenase